MTDFNFKDTHYWLTQLARFKSYVTDKVAYQYEERHELLAMIDQLEGLIDDGGVSAVKEVHAPETSSELYEFLENAPEPIIVCNTKLNIIYGNHIAMELLGLDKPNSPVRRYLLTFLVKNVAEFLNWVSGSSTHTVIQELSTINGVIAFEVNKQRIRMKGETLFILSMHVASEAMDESIRQWELWYRNAFTYAREAMFILDAERRFIAVNNRFCEITGYSEDEALGQSPTMLTSGSHDEGFYKEFYETLYDTGIWEGVIYNKAKSGHSYPQDLRAVALFLNDESSRPDGYIGIFENIESRVRHEMDLKDASETDPLTGLMNRNGFNSTMEQLFAEAERNGYTLTLIYIDMDRFKQLNDTHGHSYGDEMLRVLSGRLRHIMKSDDILARLGGDEFVVLLEGELTEAMLESILNKLLRHLGEPYRIFDTLHDSSASLGVARYPNDALSIDGLIQAADAAMYQAKKNGRNCYQFFDKNVFDQEFAQEEFINQINTGFIRDEFIPYFQPQFSLIGKEIVGFESLCRWLTPGGKVIAPGGFLPEMEKDKNLMTKLALSMIRHVFRTVDILIRHDFRLPVALNLSATQLASPRVIEHLIFMSETHPDAAKLIEIEITETTLFEGDPAILDHIEQLQEIGFEFVLDDFGTGFSSIYSLKQIRFKKIKIDRSFVMDIGDRHNTNLLDGMIGLIQQLDLEIICEGIETEEQLNYLVAKGCRVGQGFYYSPAVSTTEAAKMLHLNISDV